MGEIREDDDPVSAWAALLEHAELYRSSGLGPVADRLAASGPLVLGSGREPVIIDTDIGGDPDDAVAVAVAARTIPSLALVITADEFRGDGRARFARQFLDALGRPEIPVIAGQDLGNTRYFCVEGLTASDATSFPSDVLTAVHDICDRTDGKVRWVGMGPMSNLAALLAADPALGRRLEITQMGGAVNYRKPGGAEHNIRLDPAAARRVIDLAAPRSVSLVLSDVTFRPDTDMAVRTSSPLYQHLAANRQPWAQLLVTHLDRWYSDFFGETLMHDPLTLSAALRLPFVNFSLERVCFAEGGQMSLDNTGQQVFLSMRADYQAFARWLHKGLEMKADVAMIADESGPRRA